MTALYRCCSMMCVFARLVSLMLISGLVCADDRDKTTRLIARFEALDRDADHRLNRSEASADESISARFSILDANGDEYLSMREFAGSKSPGPMPESEARQPQ